MHVKNIHLVTQFLDLCFTSSFKKSFIVISLFYLKFFIFSLFVLHHFMRKQKQSSITDM